MRLLNLTSISELPAFIGTTNNRLTTAETNILAINGTGPGSISKFKVDAKAYADGIVGGVDLSQVATNQVAISGLLKPAFVGFPTSLTAYVNGDKMATNTLNTAKVNTLVDRTNVAGADIATLNGDITVIGSIDKAVADVVGTAPVELDTFSEIQAQLDAGQTLHDSMLGTSNDNRAAFNASLIALDSLMATKKADFIANNVTRLASLDATIATKNTEYITAQDALFLKRSNNLSDLANPAAARATIGVGGFTEITDYVRAIKPVFKEENFVVATGRITLPSNITNAHVQSIRILYNGGTSFDDITVNVAAGIATVHDTVAGDLDGTTVTVRYVTPTNTTLGV